MMQNHCVISSKYHFWTRNVSNSTKSPDLVMSGPVQEDPYGPIRSHMGQNGGVSTPWHSLATKWLWTWGKSHQGTNPRWVLQPTPGLARNFGQMIRSNFFRWKPGLELGCMGFLGKHIFNFFWGFLWYFWWNIKVFGQNNLIFQLLQQKWCRIIMSFRQNTIFGPETC